MHTRKLYAAGAALALAATVAGCGGSGGGSSSGSGSGGSGSGSTSAAVSAASLGGAQDRATLEALYKKAVAAGQRSVVVYGPSAGTDTDMYKAFERAFPDIKVTGVPIVGPPMSAKLQAEFSSRKHVGDIAFTGGTNMVQYAQSGWFQPFTPATAPAASEMAADNVGPNDDFEGMVVSVAGVVYNTSTVKSPPTSWTDFEDTAKYKGKIAMYDPTAVGEMEDVFAHLALVPGDSGVEAALKAEDAQLFPASSITGPVTAVAQGAKQIALEMSYAFYLPAKSGGAPVGFSLLKSDNYTTTLYMGIIKGAPDPLASELYEDWAMTPDGGKAIAQEGEYSAVLGNAPPTGLPALADVPTMPNIPLSQIIPADNAAIKKAQTYWS